jgi:hypothetical protein
LATAFLTAALGAAFTATFFVLHTVARVRPALLHTVDTGFLVVAMIFI